MRLPTLRTAPHYFVINSIGGMNEGYSDTTCRRIEDVVAPEYGKAMVEEYIDQWVHDRLEYYTECIAETGATFDLPVRYNLEECPRGGWVKLTPEFNDNLDQDFLEDMDFHTLFIQVYDGTMLGDSVVVYDQMDDSVTTITARSTAIRMAEECISIDVERIKQKIYEGEGVLTRDLKYYNTNLIYAYDCLAEVVRELEYPQECMIDIDDTCTHYFPVQAMKVMTYNGNNVIITL